MVTWLAADVGFVSLFICFSFFVFVFCFVCLFVFVAVCHYEAAELGA